jgi:hypothetical protein
MHKELFVYRNTHLFPLPEQLNALKKSFVALGNVLEDCMKAIVTECDLGDCLGEGLFRLFFGGK